MLLKNGEKVSFIGLMADTIQLQIGALSGHGVHVIFGFIHYKVIGMRWNIASLT